MWQLKNQIEVKQRKNKEEATKNANINFNHKQAFKNT